MPPDKYRILQVYLKVLIFLRGTLRRVASLPVHFFLSVQQQTGMGAQLQIVILYSSWILLLHLRCKVYPL